MAERKVTIPGVRAPMVNKEGQVNPTWLKFFNDLYERTGGGAEDLVESGSEDTQAAQDAADAAANSAQIAQDLADEIERRLDFDIDFELQ